MSYKHPRTRYYWRGLNTNKKPAKGYIVAPNKITAKRLLQQQGLQIKWLTQAFFFSRMMQRITSQDVLNFLRQLALLLHAGLPLLPAFDTLRLNHYNPQMDLFIEQMKRDIQEGYTLASVLRQYPKYCNSILCSIVEAGEQSGTLVPILLKFARYQEQTTNIQKKLKTILIYPCTVFIITLILSFLLLRFVIPQFVILFNQFGAPLPWPTRSCIALSQGIQHYGYFFFLSLFLAAGVIRYAAHHWPKFKYQIDLWILKIPLFSSLLKKSITARFCYTLALLLHAGLPLLEGLRLIAPITGNAFFKAAMIKISEQIREGLSLTQALRVTHPFSSTVTQMIAIGEESGKLESMLLHIAKQQEEAFFNLTFLCSRMLEPGLMIFLGLWIGALIIAMYLPIFHLGAAI